MNKNIIIIPTYNEKDNIIALIKKIRKMKVPADILVVDDNSPDGTGKYVDNFTKLDKGLFVIHRQGKMGLGSAYIEGFKWGMKNNYRKFVSMDADFSHPVEAIFKLLQKCDRHSIAIGSRYIRGGKIVGWGLKRYINSWGANLVTRIMLGIKVKDVTSGFKCYPIEFIRSIKLNQIRASGYAFLVEMTLLAENKGFKLIEVPITFVDRRVGESKIQGELKKSVKIVFQLALKRKK